MEVFEKFKEKWMKFGGFYGIKSKFVMVDYVVIYQYVRLCIKFLVLFVRNLVGFMKGVKFLIGVFVVINYELVILDFSDYKLGDIEFILFVFEY